MSKCPKCNQKIPLYHLGQKCPHCGVNVRFYNFEEEFYLDAKKAELSVANIDNFIARLKGALIGSKLAIARLCVMILPLLSLLVPYANVTFKIPLMEKSLMLSGLGVYLGFSDGFVDFVMGMLKSNLDGDAYFAFVLAVAGLVLVALAALLVLLCSILSFTNVKKMQKILCVYCIIGAVFSVVAAFFAARLSSANALTFSSKISFGYIASIIGFAVNFAINFLLDKKGLNIVYKEGNLERAEISKKVKKGELKIEDLPQPIVETEETRLIKEEIAAQQALYRQKENAEVSAE